MKERKKGRRNNTPQPVRHPLPFKSYPTNTVLVVVWLQHNMGVYRTPCCPNYRNIVYIPVAIVDCIHIRSATASFEYLATLHKRILQQVLDRGSVMASLGHGDS